MNPSIGVWGWWKRVGVAISLMGLAGILWTFSLLYGYKRTLPRSPDPVAGRVYPLDFHGIVIYQTRHERNWLDEIQYSSVAALLVGGLMGLIHDRKFGRPLSPPTVGPKWQA
jgi:hypothetical protein